MSSMNSQQTSSDEQVPSNDQQLAVWTEPYRGRCHACGSSSLTATSSGYTCNSTGCNHVGDKPYDMKLNEKPHPWNQNDGPSKKSRQTKAGMIDDVIQRLPETAISFTANDIATRSDLTVQECAHLLSTTADPDHENDPFENYTLRTVKETGRYTRYQVVPY